MKQEQFKALEGIDKKAWGELAVSGDNKLPHYLSKFFVIALRARLQKGLQ
ncbi:MAG: hypothetical protein PHO27_12105 [Sulfuricurvum sp.]|jgi:hypothetical protein|nr:hypothetical protein [Sulfuricurvum sp.]